MFKNKIHLLVLGSIVLIAAFLRIYKLDTLPPSLEWDEVATGYDAYSILRTGRDQFGTYLPLTIRSLDDYKPPLYTYLTAGSIAVLGWNDFAVRFPAALLGVFAVITTYGMVEALFGNRKLSLLTALFLAISPWHINFSRLALETNSTIFFTTAGVWAFLAGLRKGYFLPLSALLLGLNLYLYHNARVFIPLLGLVLLILYWKELIKQWRWGILAAVITLVFCIRLIPIVTSIEGQMRFNGTSMFASVTPGEIEEGQKLYAKWRLEDSVDGSGFFGKIVHHRVVFYGLRLFRNYLTHFNPTFWLFTDDYPRHHAPELGLLYFVDLPLLLIGPYFLARYKNKRGLWLLLAWVLFAPIPSAVTRDVPHALRVTIILPTVQLIIAAAILGLMDTIRWKRTFAVVLIAAYVLNITFFLHQFYYHYAIETSEFWQYGRREAAQFAQSEKSKYDRVIVSTRLEQPHMFFLYYLRYDPVKYLAQGGTVSGGWAQDRNHFDTYEFKPISYKEMKDDKTLFVGLPDEFPGVQPLKEIKYLNGKPAIWITN